jgi:hypothetical protein
MTHYIVGDFSDIRTLEKSTSELVILYFEPELARNSTYKKDLIAHRGIPAHMCPFIEISEFLDFQREMSPVFDDSLAAVPLMIEIVGIEEDEGRTIVKGLLPFLDEIDFEEEENSTSL